MLPRDSRLPLKRRVDYRPPAFLVDSVALEFDLEPEATRVTARLTFRRNPGAVLADRAAPLVLDGEEQESVSVELDGMPIAPPRYQLGAGRLTLSDPPPYGEITVRSTIAPATGRVHQAG